MFIFILYDMQKLRLGITTSTANFVLCKRDLQGLKSINNCLLVVLSVPDYTNNKQTIIYYRSNLYLQTNITRRFACSIKIVLAT